MSHPITGPDAKGLRDRVASFVHDGLHRTSATNIIFVCGGDEAHHLRPRFIDYMLQEMPLYRPFLPEAAQEDYFQQDPVASLNLSKFEELVSDLSLGIVLFAESPGSYAETGLFSALENARQKTLVIMDAARQGRGSFLSFGPVAVISEKSRLGAAIQLDYGAPNFRMIKDRIEDRLTVRAGFRAIGEKDFSQLKSIEVMALIWFYVDYLRAADLNDLTYLFKSAFNGHAAPERIKQIISVLVGAKLLQREGPLGLLRVADPGVRLTEPAAAKQNAYQRLNLAMADLIDGGCDVNYVEAMAHAA